MAIGPNPLDRRNEMPAHYMFVSSADDPAHPERTRDWYELERQSSGRCPRCGSTDLLTIDRYDDGIDVGVYCAECPYRWEYTDDQPAGPPYIAPGEPGSRDRPDDYEDDA